MDRETVITHLQIIHVWARFARERDLQFFTAKHLEDIAQWSDDAIELLKEQEDLGTELTNAVELIHKKNERIEKLLKEKETQKFFVDENGKITPLPIVIPNCPLKEQEAKKVLQIRNVAYRTIGYCPSCGRVLDSYEDGNSGDHITNYCYNCGQAVKWE